MFFLCLDYWASHYIIQLESQNISLDISCKLLSSENVCRSSSNLQFLLGGYLSPPTRVTVLARAPHTCNIWVHFILYKSTYQACLSMQGFEPLTLRPSNRFLILKDLLSIQCYISYSNEQTFNINRHKIWIKDALEWN